MAGHSKWHNIQARKGAQDAKRGKLFQKLSKEIFVAAKMGEPNPDTNPSLRLAIEKAKAQSMPKDNIDRAVAKASGAQAGENYDEITYEGYAPHGIAIMVECLTDNRNRTASSVRANFSKNDGNLGENGSVSYMFDRKGVLVVDRSEYPDFAEDDMLLLALDAGAEDVDVSEEVFVIYTEPNDFETVKNALTAETGIAEYATAEITFVPANTIELGDEEAEKVNKLIEALEDNDDVQGVYHNMD